MEGEAMDLSSPSGSQPSAENPPVMFNDIAAGARILEAPTPCCKMATLVGDLGCGGSMLLDPGNSNEEVTIVDHTDDTYSLNTLTQSMESVLLREEESAGNNSTVNPLSQISLSEKGVSDKLSKSQLKRRRKAKAKARAMEASKIAEVASGLSSGTPKEGAVKRTRSVEESSNTDLSFGTKPCSSSAGTKRRKRRKVAGKAESSSASSMVATVSVPSGNASVDASSTEVLATGSADKATAGPSDPQKRPKTTAGSGKSFSEAAATALMVVIRSNTQEGLSKQQITFLEDHIWKVLGETKESPKFEGMFVRDGALNVRCADERSLNWLIHTVDRIPAQKGVKFVATKSNNLLKLTKASCWIPGKSRKVSEILERLRRQNQDLDTEFWKVYAYSSKGRSPGDAEGSTLVVGLDEDSVRILKSRYGLRPHLFFGRVKFNLSR